MAANGEGFLAGALQDDDLGSASGSAYLFHFNNEFQLSVNGRDAQLNWNSIPGATYEIEVRDPLSGSSWEVLSDSSIKAEGFQSGYTNTDGALQTLRLYRMNVR